MSDLLDLQKSVIAFRDERDWKQFHNPKDSVVALLLEASELLEYFQWKNEPESYEYLKTNNPEISDELSDVLFWVLLIAYDFDIDIKDAFKLKLRQNIAKYPVSKSKGSHKKYTEL